MKRSDRAGSSAALVTVCCAKFGLGFPFQNEAAGNQIQWVDLLGPVPNTSNQGPIGARVGLAGDETLEVFEMPALGGGGLAGGRAAMLLTIRKLGVTQPFASPLFRSREPPTLP